MANICSDHLRDAELLHKSILIKPDYTSALYNLGNIYEQQGNKEKSYHFFKKIYELEPENTDSLARLCDIKKFKSGSEFEIVELLKRVESTSIESLNKCNMHYALGKAFDDCGKYKDAFFHYQKANLLDQKTLPKFNRIQHTQYIDSIINKFTSKLENKSTEQSQISPIFICGMFRSGSTLAEQILAAHPEVTCGGELEFFHRIITNENIPFPECIAELTDDEKQEIALKYEKEINLAFDDVNIITDKRPDNILYLGFIKSIFPKAKVVITKRNMLDNCLSVFFLRLGASMNYATAFEDTIFYYKEQLRLIEHWLEIYKEDIHLLDYDSLIQNPKNTTCDLLSFIGLTWDDKCAEFYNVKNSVKTASVWQVRQPIYKNSSGRWTNYADELKMLGLSL